jgi:preprotein translocase subunit SecA
LYRYPEQLKELMLEYAELTVDDIVAANLDASVPVEEWPLVGPVYIQVDP